MAKYIELEDAYKTLSDYYHHSTDNQHMALREALDRVPAADVVERKTGKWMPIKTETGVEAFGFKEMTVNAFCCSACGKEVDVSEGDFNFCRFCGSKMIGGDEDV